MAFTLVIKSREIIVLDKKYHKDHRSKSFKFSTL